MGLFSSLDRRRTIKKLERENKELKEKVKPEKKAENP